jgi:predicted house-cleaning noncanonical NTP pyrophosphatase (MazG superfamily)
MKRVKKMSMTYNKLIRDKIPEIIKESGKIAIVETVNQEDYMTLLVRKLFEEAGEFSKERDIKELADILEVIETLAINLDSSMDEIIKIKEDKKQERGGFSKKLKLLSVE